MTPANIAWLQQPEIQKFFRELHESSVSNIADMKRQIREFEEELLAESKNQNEDN